ncbi:MAG: branched-chain amino acid ABC transporter permease [Lachnospiraceae bacterium]|nr:branched-chain amino acid ABC transporter permease [Lachnospiraceae bacterium]
MGLVQNFKKQFAWKHFINYIVLASFIILFILLNSFGVLRKGDRSTLTRIGYSMILAVSLNLIVGFLGELSLGHAGFMCVGAYIGCFVFNQLEPAFGGGIVTLLLSMVSGGVTAAVFGFIIGVPALRLKGDYLAITTLAFGEIVRNVFKNLKLFGGAKGLSVTLYDSNTLFIIAFVTLFILLIVVQNLIRSKHGRAITAIRDNEIAARAMGVNVTYYKMLVFVLAAFAAGVAGVLYGKCVGVVRQENFDYNYSIELLVMVVLGGIGSMNGSMIAAVVVTYVNVLLQNKLSGSLAPVKLIVYALVLILIILFTNSPKLAPLVEKLSPKNLIRKLKRKDPSVIKEDEAEWRRIQTKIQMDELLRVDVKQREGELVDPDKPERGAK